MEVGILQELHQEWQNDNIGNCLNLEAASSKIIQNFLSLPRGYPFH
jgi:hypothetical protein